VDTHARADSPANSNRSIETVKKFLATLALLLWPALAFAANCTITGSVFNPDGTALANGTVQFDSIRQQTLQGGATIPRTTVSTTTNASGVMAALSLVQGIQGQFVFCSPSSGGCGSPTPVLIPIAASADISSILIGIQLSSGGNVVASSLNVTGNSTMAGTLTVTGQTSLGALNVSGAALLSGTLNVTGAAGFSTITASGTATLGAVTAPSLALTGTGVNLTGTIQMSGPLGIGTVPTWTLDIANNQNASTKAHILNNNAGTSVAALWEADNGTCQTDVGVFGTAATPSGSPFYTANEGYVIGGCPNGLLIQAAGTAAMLYLSAPNGHNVEVVGNQHFLSTNNNVSHPTPGACGTGPYVSPYATDESGFITAGSGTVTSCQVVFAAAFPQIPPCTCSTVTVGTWCTANPSTSGITLTTGANVAGSNIAWHCLGNA
jgi:hypothetical protein